MKILKISDKPTVMQKERTEANKGCDICPCCGNEDIKQYLDPVTYKKGFWFWKRFYRIDCYTCQECNARWQSEPFEVNEPSLYK